MSRALIIANMAGGGLRQPGLSGGDRIAIELVKRWSEMGHPVTVVTGTSGRAMYDRYIDSSYRVHFITSNTPLFEQSNLLTIGLHTIYSLICGILQSVTFDAKQKYDIIYSCSEFWPDAIPAYILKFRLHAKWVAGFYLFAPRPFSQESPYRGAHAIRGLLYSWIQLPILRMIKNEADFVWVTSDNDKSRFVRLENLPSTKVIVVRGGVDIKLSASIPEPPSKQFDAVFIGRFHPQKGVLELIDIWNLLCQKKKDATLVMIGKGELERKLVEKIRMYHLERNIKLMGFKDGIEKVRIFKSSKIVVHPAIYDSGGMAPCEAMICGLPGVSFDLPALATYYPRGMLKTKCFDLSEFVDNILILLEDERFYKLMSSDAVSLASEWDWDKRAVYLLDQIN